MSHAVEAVNIVGVALVMQIFLGSILLIAALIVWRKESMKAFWETKHAASMPWMVAVASLLTLV